MEPVLHPQSCDLARRVQAGAESLGLDRLFISSGLEGWRLRLPRSFGGLGGAGFA